MNKVVVAYQHDERDLQQIWLAVTTRPQPAAGEWKAAYRDTIDDRRVVWARFATTGAVWLRDRDGDRQVQAAPPVQRPVARPAAQPAESTEVEATTHTSPW